METFDCTNTGTQFALRAQNDQLICVTATLTLGGGMIPALAMLHLANLIEFSTAKDGFMWAEEGFYVYSQSGLGDPSKVCRLWFNSEEEGSEDE